MKLVQALDALGESPSSAFDRRMQNRLVMTILVGHMLVEEQLDKLISTTLQKPKALDDMQLTFAQKARLGASFSSSWDFGGDLLHGLEALDNLKRRLPFVADSNEFGTEVARVIACNAGDAFPQVAVQEDLARSFRFTLTAICGALRDAAASSRLSIPQTR